MKFYLKSIILVLIVFINLAGLAQNNLHNNLVACYPMDCSGTDFSGNNYNATLNGNIICSTDRSSNVGGALQFGGTPLDFITLPNPSPPALNLFKSQVATTISGWFFVNSINQEILIFANNGCGFNFDAFTLIWDGPNSQFMGIKRPGPGTCGNGQSISVQASNNGWHHVVFFLDNNNLGLIVDNAIGGNAQITFLSPSIPFNYQASTGFFLGGSNNASNKPFTGKMDDIRIWNRQLSNVEVDDLFNNAPACNVTGNPINCGTVVTPAIPIGSWDFSGNLLDGSGNGNNGTAFSFANNVSTPITNNTIFTRDRCGFPNSAIHFNGNAANNQGEYIQLSAGGNLPFTNLARSVSFWMRSNNKDFAPVNSGNSVNKVRTILAYGEYSSGITGTRWEICHNYGCEGIGIDISMEYVTDPPQCDVNDGRWHHVAITQAANASLNSARLYLDGVEVINPWSVGCSPTTNNSVNGTIPQLMTFGALLDGNISNVNTMPTRFFNGDLDDVRIYDQVLSDNQIEDLSKCSCEYTYIYGPSIVCPGQTYTYRVNQGAEYGWNIPSGPGWVINSGGGVNDDFVTLTAGSLPGNVSITMTVPCQPIQTGVLAVQISTRCCTQPTTGLTPLTGNLDGNYTGAFFLENNITVSGSSGFAVFKDAEVRIMPGVKITVPSNYSFGLQHAHLYSCGDHMWDGIVIDDGANIQALNPGSGSNLIEDAKIAIDVQSISNNHAANLVNLQQVIFNKNHVGIKFEGHPTQSPNHLQVIIKECIFTSRNIQFFTTPPFTFGSWRNASIQSLGFGLRWSAPATTQWLPSPFLFWNEPRAALKGPFTNQPGEIGIMVRGIGNQGSQVNIGLEINPTVALGVASPDEFNLFDGIGTGIDVEDASLTTRNNVFQDLLKYWPLLPPYTSWVGDGIGIKHTINSSMNARLDLKPDVNTYGNRFWNCYEGVTGNNVYEVDIEKAIFRSTHHSSDGNNLLPGSIGVLFVSNRFNYNVSNCEFNNINYNLNVTAVSGPYHVGSINGNGTYAKNILFKQNYFGPETTSVAVTIPGFEYTNYAIRVIGSTSGPWDNSGTCKILGNKIDRAYRGIQVESMDKFPTEIGGNYITLTQDLNFLPPPITPQFGIHVFNSQDNLSVLQNEVSGPQLTGTDIVCISLAENKGSVFSPIVGCNKVYNADVGFEFSGYQPNTKWESNEMNTPMTYGFSLRDFGVSPGEIGPQGSMATSSGNYWVGNWPTTTNPSGPPYYTRTLGNVNPANSPIYPDLFFGPPAQFPNFSHWPVSGPNQYITNSGSGDTFIVGGNANANDCANSNLYPNPPSQRQMNSGATDISIIDNWIVSIHPNPSNGILTVSSSNDKELLKLRIMDVTGKLVFTKDLSTSDSKTIDISFLKASLYIIEIENEAGKRVRKKLVKE